MKQTVLLLTVLLLGTQSFGQDISASYGGNDSFAGNVGITIGF